MLLGPMRRDVCGLLPVLDTFEKADTRYQAARDALQMGLGDSAPLDMRDAARYYRHARAMLNGMNPPTRLRHVHQLLQQAADRYSAGADVLTRDLKHKDFAALSTQTELYLQGNSPKNKATAELLRVRREAGLLGNDSTCPGYVPPSTYDSSDDATRPDPKPTPNRGPAAPQSTTSSSTVVASAAPPRTRATSISSAGRRTSFKATSGRISPHPSGFISPRARKVYFWLVTMIAALNTMHEGSVYASKATDYYNQGDAGSSTINFRMAQADFDQAARIVKQNRPPVPGYLDVWNDLHQSAVLLSRGVAELLQWIVDGDPAKFQQAQSDFRQARAQLVYVNKRFHAIAAHGRHAALSGIAPVSGAPVVIPGVNHPSARPPKHTPARPPKHAPVRPPARRHPAPAPTPISTTPVDTSPVLASYVGAQRRGLTHVGDAAGSLTEAIGDIESGDVESGAVKLQRAHDLLLQEQSRLATQQAPTSNLSLVGAREGRAIKAFFNAYGYTARALFSAQLSTVRIPDGYRPGRYAVYGIKVPAYLRYARNGMQRGGVRLNKANDLLGSMHLSSKIDTSVGVEQMLDQ